jgi:hypothetical protein
MPRALKYNFKSECVPKCHFGSRINLPSPYSSPRQRRASRGGEGVLGVQALACLILKRHSKECTPNLASPYPASRQRQASRGERVFDPPPRPLRKRGDSCRTGCGLPGGRGAERRRFASHRRSGVTRGKGERCDEGERGAV